MAKSNKSTQKGKAVTKVAPPKKRGRKKGSKGPTKKDRIARLQEVLPKNQVSIATKMAKETPHAILTLAYLMAEKPKNSAGVKGLATTIESLTPDKQQQARELIAAIRAL